ncbi:MAG TPA: presqualene diphosphate synthase HpnD [Roseiarcus sp.]|nr:presqualene diphosphate synthase HpnD [Roseiarcus sp.]
MSGQPSQAPRGSSFYAAMRILPRPQRQAMYEIYGFCRAVDDIADDWQGPREARRAALQAWRGDIEALYAGAEVERLSSLAETIRAYSLPQADFAAIIAGMDMDVARDIRAPDRATFDLYCDRVACAVGRLSTRVFGLERAPGEALAEHLGRALQMTNVLRDLDEDAAIGRLYLPRETLLAAGIATDDPAAALADPAIEKAALSLVVEARAEFARADEIMDRAPRAKVRAPRLMAAAYRAILERLAKRGFAPPRERPSTPMIPVLLATLRSGFF